MGWSRYLLPDVDDGGGGGWGKLRASQLSVIK